MSSAQLTIAVDAPTFARYQSAWRHLGNPRTLPVTVLTAVDGFGIPSTLTATGVEILSAIGRACTRPDDPTAPAAAFAILKYSESIADSPELALAEDLIDLDSHKKTVVSDEFGCGMALLMAERYLATPRLMDVESGISQGSLATDHPRSRRPDYFGETAEATPRVLILEAKGTQSGLPYAKKQVESGCGQLPMVNLSGAWAGRPAVRTVVSTSLARVDEASNTTILVGDPEPANEKVNYELREDLVRAVSRAHYGRLATLTGDRDLLVRTERRARILGVPMVPHRFGEREFLGVVIAITGPQGVLMAFAGVDSSMREPYSVHPAYVPKGDAAFKPTTQIDVASAGRPVAALSNDGFLLWLSGG